MTRFKVGDTVRVIDPDGELADSDSPDGYHGKIGKIVQDDKTSCPYKVEFPEPRSHFPGKNYIWAHPHMLTLVAEQAKETTMQKEFTFTVTLTFDEDLAGKEKELADALARHLAPAGDGEEFASHLEHGPLVDTAKVSIEVPVRQSETYTAERS